MSIQQCFLNLLQKLIFLKTFTEIKRKKSKKHALYIKETLNTQSEVIRVFYETFPDLSPISQVTIKKIVKQFREHGDVRQIKKAPSNAMIHDTKSTVMLEFEDNSHTSVGVRK